MNKRAQLIIERLIKEIDNPNEDITVKLLCEHYLEFTKRNRSAKTCVNVTLICNKFLTYYSPLRKLSTIKLRDAEQFIDWIRKTAPRGVDTYLRAIRTMFNKAVSWNYISESVFNKVKLPKRQSEKPACVNEVLLWKIVEFITIEVIRDVVITAFYTSCRRGELVQLAWQNVNLVDKVIIIGSKEHNTKNRKQRVIPIHPRVEEILVKRLQRGKSIGHRKREKPTPLIPLQGGDKYSKGYVFCKKNSTPFTGDFISKRFKRACREAGISEDIHFHSIRHGSITRMIMQGSPLPVVQSIAGHAQLQTLMIYTHPDIDSLRDAVNRL